MKAYEDFQVVEDTPFFAPASTDMIDGLVSQYQAMRRQIGEIAGFITPRLDGGAIGYFLDGNKDDDRGRNSMSMSARQLFDEAGAVAALNAAYWSKALALTDVLDAMPQKRRDEWNAQIRNPRGIAKPRRAWDKGPVEWEQPPIPDFEETTVRDTIMGMLNMRSQFLAERVDGIFRGLSGQHVTNAPEAFGKRMIIANVLTSYGTVDHTKSGLINDLRCVIAKFMGRDEPSYRSSDAIVARCRLHRGEWIDIDGGALRMRVYAIGTAHLEVHPDMAWRLNCILSQLHPLAIPAEFRQRPKKKLRKFELLKKPLPSAVVEILASMEESTESVPKEQRTDWRQSGIRRVRNTRVFRTGSQEARDAAELVLAAIGGAKQAQGHWLFDYEPSDVIGEIVASGCIPDQRAHQFYPTPAALARVLVDMAQIGDGHTILEPSAGQGGLADLLPKERTTCVEVAELNAKVLEAKGHRVERADFLSLDAQAHQFDRIVMNPPFSDGRAEAHTRHAADMLAPGGRLVAILPSGMRGRDIPGLACSWSKPMANQFPGVSIEVVLLQADRPATERGL